MLLSPNTLLSPDTLLAETPIEVPDVAELTISRWPTNALSRYDVGDAIVFRGAMRNEVGDPITDATVMVRVLHGTTELSFGAALEQDAGVYSVTVDLDVPGAWRIRMESDDPRAAEEDLVYVRSTSFAAA